MRPRVYTDGLALAAAAGLSGCAGLHTAMLAVAGERIDFDDLGSLPAMSAGELCFEISSARHSAREMSLPAELDRAADARLEAVAAEAAKRGLFGDDDLALAMDRRIRVGMPVCGLLAAWGRPERVNRTVTAGGASEQWVYSYIDRRGQGARRARRYAYVADGKITAWQD